MIREKITYIFILISLVTSLQGQDVSFSQFYSSPLSLNPALTGLTRGDFRVILNYHNQNSYLIPSSVYGGSFDIKLLRSKLENDVFATGLFATNESMIDGAVSNTVGMASLAYHKSLGASGRHFVTLGIQGGMFQRYMDLNGFAYGSQWDPSSGFDPGIANGESFSSDQTSLVDVNAGLLWYSFLPNDASIFGGFSVFHLLEPEDNYLQDKSTIPRRYLAHGGTRYPVTNEWVVIPNLLFMMQNASKELVVGTNLEYQTEKVKVYGGGWYRLGDSFIVTGGFGLGSLQIGVSYDLIINSDLSYSESKGGFEISLIYSKKLKKVVELNANPGGVF